MKKISLITLIGFTLFSAVPAYATNGTKLIGNGPSVPIMGGVGVAEPQDTGGLLINPAGLTKIGNQFNLGLETNIIDLKINTEDAPGGGIANSVGTHESLGELFFIPHIGISKRHEESNFYYGLAIASVSGLKSDFKFSRIGVAANTYDRHIESGTVEIAPSFAYKLNEKLSVGVAPVLSFTYLTSDITTAVLTQTKGGDDTSYSWGGGFNIGAIYDIHEKVSLGFSYKSGRWNSDLDDYSDSLPRLNGIPEYIWGIAFKPTSKLLIETDAKFIHWRWDRILQERPGTGGFGWKNQWVFGIGTQYEFTDRFRMRMGYNYGRTPVKPNVLFANALTPLISEHHLGLGFGYDFTEKFSMDVGWIHTFKNQLTDDGLGDVFSGLGKGTRAELDINAINIGLTYKF